MTLNRFLHLKLKDDVFGFESVVEELIAWLFFKSSLNAKGYS